MLKWMRLRSLLRGSGLESPINRRVYILRLFTKLYQLIVVDVIYKATMQKPVNGGTAERRREVDENNEVDGQLAIEFPGPSKNSKEINVNQNMEAQPHKDGDSKEGEVDINEEGKVEKLDKVGTEEGREFFGFMEQRRS